MLLPKPVPGLVVRYSHVWRREAVEGLEEGRKDRPCTVVLAAEIVGGGTRVYVLPITHTPPIDPALAVELPLRVRLHLRLDDLPSWIVLDEINDFLWPGYDLRSVPGRGPKAVEYGHLPPKFFDTVRTAFLALATTRRVKRVPRH